MTRENVYLVYTDRELGRRGMWGGFSAIKGVYSGEDKAIDRCVKCGNFPQYMAIKLDEDIDITNE